MKYVSKHRCSKTCVSQSVILKYQRNTQKKLDFNKNVVYKFTEKRNISLFSMNFGQKINKNFFCNKHVFSIFCHLDVANIVVCCLVILSFYKLFTTCLFQILTLNVFIVKSHVETHPLATILGRKFLFVEIFPEF